jgi:hypothetical protein
MLKVPTLSSESAPCPPWLTWGETASEKISALQVLTDDGAQHPLRRVLAAASIARIDLGQTGVVIHVVSDALSSVDARSRAEQRTSWE